MLPVCEVYVRGYVRGLKWTFPLFKGVSEDRCEVLELFGAELFFCLILLSPDSRIGGMFVSIYT